MIDHQLMKRLEETAMDKEFVGLVKMLRWRAMTCGHGVQPAKQLWEFADGVVCVQTGGHFPSSWFVHYDPNRWQPINPQNDGIVWRSVIERGGVKTLHPADDCNELGPVLEFAKQSLTPAAPGFDWASEPREIGSPNVTVRMMA